MTKERLVKEAESLFFTKGFRLVSLKEICAALKIQPASLYYYFPGGKEEIYLEAIKLKTGEFKAAVESIAQRHDSLEPILVEFGKWYMAQSLMNMMLISEIDMPYLSSDGRAKVSACVGQSVFEPLGKVFGRFAGFLNRGFEPAYLVGIFSVLLFSAHTAARKGRMSPDALITSNVRLFLHGVLAPNNPQI